MPPIIVFLYKIPERLFHTRYLPGWIRNGMPQPLCLNRALRYTSTESQFLFHSASTAGQRCTKLGYRGALKCVPFRLLLRTASRQPLFSVCHLSSARPVPYVWLDLLPRRAHLLHTEQHHAFTLLYLQKRYTRVGSHLTTSHYREKWLGDLSTGDDPLLGPQFPLSAPCFHRLNTMSA